MRQLITLQLGSYANYVGAHFWNTQARCTHAWSARAGVPNLDACVAVTVTV
jgi:hypothetical protein